MNHQFYDLILAVVLFLCGFWGVTYNLEHNVSMSFGIASAVTMMCTMCYMFLVPKYAVMPDRSENKNLIRFLTEVSQKTAMLAVGIQCIIILAST